MRRFPLLVAVLGLLTPIAPAQWSTPALVTGVNTSALEYSPSPAFSGLALYYTSITGAANGEIWRATRTTPYGAFGSPVQLTELSSPQEEWAPCTRLDELEIFFTSARGGGYDLYRATRMAPTGPFNAPVPVTELNTGSTEYSPSLTLNGLQIYFTSDRPGGSGSTDIWTAMRPDWNSPFGTPVPVTELNTTTVDRDPRISSDNLVMFFTSTRTGGSGSIDLWMASRTSTSSPFGTPVNVTELNSTAIDFTPGIGAWHDELFFSSGRPGGAGGWEIYSTRFTGLLGRGVAGPNSNQELRFSDPSSPGLPYLAASALGSSPGIQFGTRTLPLNADALLGVSIGGVPPVLNGYQGVLDANGLAAGRISFQGFPHLVGLRFVTAFVVLEVTAPFGIKTISNALPTHVQ
jgi:hypothetical protein